MVSSNKFINDNKTRMTTSISSEAQKNRRGECVQVDLRCIFKMKNRFFGENKHETLFYFVQ